MTETVMKCAVAATGAIASFIFGGWSTLLAVLLTLVVIDYVTGVMASYIVGNLTSDAGLKGIAKKVFIFAMVAVAHIIGLLLGDTSLIKDAVIFFYIINEIISIFENAGRAGIPLPAKIKKAVKNLREKKAK
ncbi:toxin secretion/phage lysis holin [Evansella caseinilytica]|uniref:Toxin secretion/phage lysis holin n=1 Tax=Evansella caseinilytica TaxID=1503961 RepID=A0A1H3HS71_9BACI|nr:toxin secretion/phage lysis holin [Evansella caseinilytica]